MTKTVKIEDDIYKALLQRKVDSTNETLYIRWEMDKILRKELIKKEEK